MKSTSEPAFTIVDKRGQNRAPEEAPAQPVAHAALTTDASKTWKSTCFKYDIVQLGKGGLAMICRAVGLRGDEKPFRADVLMHPLDVNDDVDLRPIAKKRLDTFLGCECTMARGQCTIHRMTIPQWVQADERRYQKISGRPVPEALEMLHRAEMAHQSANIILPR